MKVDKIKDLDRIPCVEIHSHKYSVPPLAKITPDHPENCQNLD